ncbi:MAG TPA: type II secretion system protein [Candidatus Ozemobacteraceae bacterium]|nr:type II secretion system protein [Candidatus Ozemobacteraceae bacterium]
MKMSGRRGVTLVEIMVASTIVVLIAAVTFPVYQIIQQREKENRLRQILDNVRGAIYGCPIALANRTFNQGYRVHVLNKLANAINNATETQETRDAALASGIRYLVDHGLDLPFSPASLTGRAPIGVTFDVATGTTGTATVTIDRVFLRNIPPHPFVGWYPNARWEFVPAVYAGALNSSVLTAATDSATWESLQATGVKNIVSRGAGMAIDGTNTDDW